MALENRPGLEIVTLSAGQSPTFGGSSLCTSWRPLDPSGFKRPDWTPPSVKPPIKWVVKRACSITGLTMIVRVAPAVGETVEVRADYDGNKTPILTIVGPNITNWIKWAEGTYPLVAGSEVYLEHQDVSWVSAADLEVVVEFTLLC